ncbi:hypothetical protein E2C01_031636 [Portunus trituberculatus]|uniref:Uncharacterized protein n=1 Tax=Portunus trituberculatus TaxID=210409 RepID=A0A5B7EV75_PORTR|nr:hypothetical protein [Portunus trituberculatus]
MDFWEDRKTNYYHHHHHHHHHHLRHGTYGDVRVPGRVIAASTPRNTPPSPQAPIYPQCTFSKPTTPMLCSPNITDTHIPLVQVPEADTLLLRSQAGHLARLIPPGDSLSSPLSLFLPPSMSSISVRSMVKRHKLIHMQEN